MSLMALPQPPTESYPSPTSGRSTDEPMIMAVDSLMIAPAAFSENDVHVT